MFGFLKKSPTWSLSFALDGKSVTWAVISNTSKGPLLRSYGRSASIEEALTQVQGIAHDTIYTTSVFPSVPTLCRSLVLPKLKEREVRAALMDTLDQTTSLNVEENALAYESSQAQDGSWTIVSYITQQKILEEHLAQLTLQKVEPEHIVPKAACLVAFIAHFALSGWQLVVDIGIEEITVVLSFEDKVVESSSLIGGKIVLDYLSAPSSQEESSLYQLLQHLREITAAYKERYELSDKVPLTVTGEASPLALEAVQETVGAPLSKLHEATLKDTSFLHSASAIGGAFLSNPNLSASHPPDFRSDSHAFSQPLLHWKKPLLALSLFSVLCAASLVWYGRERALNITRSMEKDWEHITSLSHTTPEKVVTDAQKEGFEFNRPHSPEELVGQGEWLLADVEKRALFPLHPDVPRLSDFLLWLGERIEEAQKDEGSDAIYLDSCHYVLASRPTHAHPMEKYQVRVELEVTTGSAVAARALHNKLLSPNSFIDTSADVKWSGNNNKYRATFVLRDKTIYPTKES